MIAILCFQNSLYIIDIKDTELEKKKTLSSLGGTNDIEIYFIQYTPTYSMINISSHKKDSVCMKALPNYKTELKIHKFTS